MEEYIDSPDGTPVVNPAETTAVDPGRTGVWDNVDLQPSVIKRVQFRTPGVLESYAVILVGVDDGGDPETLQSGGCR